MTQKILVVEDNVPNAQLLLNLVRVMGHDAHHSSDAHQALRFLQSHTPRLVILDLRLPGMSGWELAQHIRSDARLAHIPLIAVSVEVEPDDRSAALQAGCDAYFPKPVEVRTLRNYLAELLG